MITQCPSCTTSFKVTEAQLSTADGAVRCGACLQIFRGADYIFDRTDAGVSNESVTTQGEGALEETDEGALEESFFDQVEIEKHEDKLGNYTDSDGLQGKPGEIHLDEALDIVGDYVPPKKNKNSSRIVLILGLLLLLVIQFSWFNKDILSQHPQLRTYFEHTCNLLACKIPHYVNAELLSVAGLLIRTHPTTDRALKVDAILRNDGLFKQKFPRLQLRFTDINDRTIASRNFNPDEYLRGELTGLKFIPASTEVRLALEIVDPDAVGYSFMIMLD